MTDIEALLRDTLQVRGDEIATPPAWKPAGSRTRSRASGRPWFLPALGSAALIIVVMIVTANLGPQDPPAPAEPSELVGDVTEPPPGMQAVSSLGIEILVPADWSINDTGCGQTSAPSVARGGLIALTCWTPEPFDKAIAEVGPADLNWVPAQDPYLGDPTATSPPPRPVMTMEATTVDGQAAERGRYELVGGRTAGLLRIPSADVAIAVRAGDTETVDTILDSAHLVNTDNAGCPSKRPDALAVLAETTTDPLMDLPAAVDASLCLYPIGDDSRLTASVVIDGASLADVVGQVGQLNFDATIDHDSCSEPRAAPEETLIIAARLPDRSHRYVVLAEQGCDTVALTATRDTAALVPYELYSLLLGDLLHAIPSVTG